MEYVLIVEDNLMMAEALAAMVRQFGKETRIAQTPGAALQALHHETPALVLLDLHLSGFDGDSLLRYLKRYNATEQIPVVIVSADDSPETIRRAREDGAADYLVKPVESDQLFRLLAQIGAPRTLI